MKRAITLSASALLIFAVGLAAGRWSAPEPAPAHPHATAAPATSPRSMGGSPALRPGLSAPAAGLCGHAHTAATGETSPAPVTPLGLEPALAAARLAAQAGPDEAHVVEAAKAAADGLFTRLAADPRALAQVLRRFRTLTDQPGLEMLAAVLGRLRDPEVEETALALAAQDSDPNRRAAALEILDALDTPAARGVALQVLARDTDPRLRRAALYALPPPTGASRREARDVERQLAQVVGVDPDPETRRRAALALGRWAASPTDLEPVRSALLGDRDPAVRAGAAYALELAGQRDARLLDALVLTVSAAEQPRLVRENAWKALGALSPLGPRALSAYRAYAQEREVAAEDSGG